MLQGDWRSAIYGRKLQTNGPRNLVLFAGAIEQENIVLSSAKIYLELCTFLIVCLPETWRFTGNMPIK